MVKVEKLSENRVKLTVTISVEEFDKALDLAFEKVVKEVKVDGFRPGKMPKRMFIQRFGWESLYNDAIEFAVNESYYPALKEANVYPTSQPKIDLVDAAAIKKGEAFDYTVEIDVWPEVHLGEYKGVKVKKASTRVLKKDVEEFINKALQSKTDNVLKDTPAEKGDTVILDFEGFIDGVAFEGGKAENYSLELGSNSFVPGFEDQLVGAKTNDEVEVKVTFPENYHEGLANKEAVFKCKIHEVKTKKVPELNDEFVADLDIKDVHNVEEYREFVKKDLLEKAEKNEKSRFFDALLDKIVANATVKIPEEFVNEEVENMFNNLKAQVEQNGLDMDAYFKITNSKEEDVKAKMAVDARKNIERFFVLDEVGKKEEIEVNDAAIELEIAKMAEQYGMPAEKIKEIVCKDENAKARFAGDIRQNQIVTFLLNNNK